MALLQYKMFIIKHQVFYCFHFEAKYLKLGTADRTIGLPPLPPLDIQRFIHLRKCHRTLSVVLILFSVVCLFVLAPVYD